MKWAFLLVGMCVLINAAWAQDADVRENSFEGCSEVVRIQRHARERYSNCNSASDCVISCYGIHHKDAETYAAKDAEAEIKECISKGWCREGCPPVPCLKPYNATAACIENRCEYTYFSPATETKPNQGNE